MGDGYAAARLLALARLKDDGYWVNQTMVGAVEALGHLRRFDDLLALAQDRTVEAWVQERAAEALGKLGRTDEAANLLLTLAQDQTVGAWVRERAAEALGELGPADEAAKLLAAEAWLALARDRAVEIRVRVRAAEALGELGRAGDLLTLVQDWTVGAWVQGQAAEALGKLGPADEAAEALLALAQKVNCRVRMQAAEALGKLERATPKVLAGLWELAEEPGTPWTVRRVASEALKRLEGGNR